jgi:hypothetical protein
VIITDTPVSDHHLASLSVAFDQFATVPALISRERAHYGSCSTTESGCCHNMGGPLLSVSFSFEHWLLARVTLRIVY